MGVRGLMGFDLYDKRVGVMFINTSREGRYAAVIDARKSEKNGQLGLDVYEEEEELLIKDLSGRVMQDDVFFTLLRFPNVVLRGYR